MPNDMIVLLGLAFGVLVVVRLIYLLVLVPSVSRNNNNNAAGGELPLPKRSTPVRTMIVMGSGGHTAEMMQIAERLDCAKYAPREYVIAAADKTSVVKVIELEGGREPDPAKQQYGVSTISRSRYVKQSYLSALFTTLFAIFRSVPVVLAFRPELILTNGPGTCVPVCLVAFLAKALFINRRCKIVFVESFCRVRSLSLSGRILLWITDLFVVQWPGLAVEKVPNGRNVEYFGRLTS